MKVAIVHELLTMKGGAERVAKIFSEMFPEAPIFTLLYDESVMGDWFPKSRIRTSFVQKNTNRYSLTTNHYNHHLYLNKFPAAVEAWDFSKYDLVLSSSSAFIHGIITNGKPKHLCYVQSPARYLWDRTHDVIDEASHGILGPLKRRYLERTFHRLRIWDTEAADRPDVVLAASKEVQRRIELYWRRESEVVYPPVDDVWLRASSDESRDLRSSQLAARDHFLIVSTLSRYKRIDLAIQAAHQLGVPLKIAGTGPDKHRLKKLAGPTIEFLGFRSEEELKDLYANAKALIFPGEEDFGLTPLEAMACGTPVIAYKKGGALETIVDGSTGTFFDEPTAESLSQVMQLFDQSRYSSDTCRAQAERFNRKNFEKKILEKIKQMMSY
jgi:glycosyltransferase involved in cell wall biosynthesis